MIEQWRRLFYQGVLSDKYEVSSFGNIRNAKTKRLLKPQYTGYAHVRIFHNGRMQNIRIHRAVASTFLIRGDGEDVVNHRDGNKTNNHVSNLEWLSQGQNVRNSLLAREKRKDTLDE